MPTITLTTFEIAVLRSVLERIAADQTAPAKVDVIAKPSKKLIKANALNELNKQFPDIKKYLK